MFDAVVSKEQHQLYAPNDHTCHFRVCGRGIVSQAQPTSLAVFGPLLRACFATSKMDLILRMAPSASDNGRSLPLSDIGSSCPFAINGMDRSAAYTAWREILTICRPQITTRLLSSTLTLHAENHGDTVQYSQINQMSTLRPLALGWSQCFDFALPRCSVGGCDPI
jgi:hypothetical protein